MENLHAPWRIQYVLRPKQPGATESVFTRIARSNDDIENFVIYRGKTCYSCLDAFPYNGGHILVCPYREVPDFAALTDEEMLELMHQTRRCIDALKQTMKPHGFNVGVNLGQPNRRESFGFDAGAGGSVVAQNLGRCAGGAQRGHGCGCCQTDDLREKVPHTVSIRRNSGSYEGAPLSSRR